MKRIIHQQYPHNETKLASTYPRKASFLRVVLFTCLILNNFVFFACFDKLIAYKSLADHKKLFRYFLANMAIFQTTAVDIGIVKISV